jgi:hypothetical protein
MAPGVLLATPSLDRSGPLRSVSCTKYKDHSPRYQAGQYYANCGRPNSFEYALWREFCRVRSADYTFKKNESYYLRHIAEGVFSNWFFPARATPAFKQLYNPSDYFQTGHLYGSDDMDWIDGAFSKLVPLRRHGPLYTQQLSDALRGLQSFPQATKDSHFVCDIQTALGADSAQNTLADYYDSTSMNGKIRLYCNQKKCLKEFLSLAAKRRQKVLLVSLPLRQDAQHKLYQPLDCDYRKFLQEL